MRSYRINAEYYMKMCKATFPSLGIREEIYEAAKEKYGVYLNNATRVFHTISSEDPW